MRIIESECQKVQLIDSTKINTSKVALGTRVVLKNLQDDTFVSYAILGRWDTDLEKNIISNEAPVGQMLLGKVRGDQITIDGIEYEITGIEKAIE